LNQYDLVCITYSLTSTSYAQVSLRRSFYDVIILTSTRLNSRVLITTPLSTDNCHNIIRRFFKKSQLATEVVTLNSSPKTETPPPGTPSNDSYKYVPLQIHTIALPDI
jgi:hypothetical protein